MDLQNVFGYLRVLGGEPPPLTIVGCEPRDDRSGDGPLGAGGAIDRRRRRSWSAGWSTNSSRRRRAQPTEVSHDQAIVRTAIAVGFALFAARQLVYGGRDLARYNKMREMSGDPPLGVPTQKPETNAEARTTNPFAMLASIPERLARYLKLKSM